MKRGNQKRTYKFSGFSFLGFEIGANRFSMTLALGILTFFFIYVGVVPQKAAKLENLG